MAVIMAAVISLALGGAAAVESGQVAMTVVGAAVAVDLGMIEVLMAAMLMMSLLPLIPPFPHHHQRLLIFVVG